MNANMIYPSAHITYPTTYPDYPEGHVDFKVFRTEAQRHNYIQELITDKIPNTPIPLTKTSLRNFLENENIELKFYDLDMPKNGGSKHWPVAFSCPLCNSMNLIQHAFTVWETESQDWALNTEGNTAICLDCNEAIHPKDYLIPITLEP